jgi:thiol-disulfide isomerase/thioredoxin
MFKQTIFFGFALGMLVAFNTAFNAVSGNETQKPIPASLDEATTSEEIAAYVEHAFQESQKNLKTMEDEERFLETYPPIGIAAGRKIIALGGNDESLKKGYGILLGALSWSFKKHPENVKEYEALVEEIKKTGKFPELVESARFFLFYQRWRTFTEKIAISEFSTIKNEFEAIKEEAKELTALKRTKHLPTGPMEIVLDLAREISTVNDNSRFLDDVLEEMVRFVTSDHFDNDDVTESFLRGYRRRMVGSPFELWGKTVDGNDFNWTDYKEKVILVNFTASWCGPCREEMPNIVEMHEKYHKKGLEIVFIGVRDTTDNLKKMTEEDKVGFPMISEELSKEDSRGLPSTHYSIFGVPSIFLVDKNGRIIATGLRDHVLRDTIEKHFAEKNAAQ